jgi:hypothetical protein
MMDISLREVGDTAAWFDVHLEVDEMTYAQHEAARKVIARRYVRCDRKRIKVTIPRSPREHPKP